MKKQFTFLLIISAFAFIQCKNNTERVSLTSDISVKLPVKYTKTKDTIENMTLFTAMNNHDEIFIAKVIIEKLDTFSLDEKRGSIVKNLNCFMKPLNGKNLINNERVIGETVQSDFSFEFDKKNLTFVIFGNLIVKETDFIILSYKTQKPISNRSKKEKDIFFKSIIIK